LLKERHVLTKKMSSLYILCVCVCSVFAGTIKMS